MKRRYHMGLVVALIASAGSASLWAGDATQESLKTEAKISHEAASRTALAKVPGGSIQSSELEREHGMLIWSFDIARPTTRNITEVQVDAKTGAVVSETTETPKQQRAEAIKEKGEHK